MWRAGQLFDLCQHIRVCIGSQVCDAGLLRVAIGIDGGAVPGRWFGGGGFGEVGVWSGVIYD